MFLPDDHLRLRPRPRPRLRHPRGRLRAAVLATFLPVGVAAAQEAAVQRQLDAAAVALQQKQPEAAVLALDAAREALAGVRDEELRAALAAKVVALRDKADPAAKTVAAATAAAAAKLLEVSRQYADAGWFETAIDYAKLAARVAPELANEELTSLHQRRAKHRAATSAGVSEVGAAALEHWFGDGEVVAGPHGWDRAGNVLRAPKVTGTSPATFLSGRRVRRLGEFAADVRLSADAAGALLFGYRNVSDKYVVHVRRLGEGLWFALDRHRPESVQRLAEQDAALPAAMPGEASPPIRVAIAVHGNVVEVRVGKALLRHELPGPVPHGLLGLMAFSPSGDAAECAFESVSVQAEAWR